MSLTVKSLSQNLHGIWVRYQDDMKSAMASAEETIESEMAAVKAELGLAGLKVTFHDDQDSSGALLETKVDADDDWDNWDELGYQGADKDGRLKALNDLLEEMAPYLEWNGKEIAV